MITTKRAIAWSLLLALAACDAPRSVPGADAAAGGDGPPATDQALPDRGRADAGRKPDLGCRCPPGKVWLRGPCVATSALGTCAPSCKIGDPAACVKGWRCDQWAATTFCYSAAALPACVRGPAMGFAAGTLRISPQSGVAGAPAQVSIEGGEYYIGALHWMVAFGDKLVQPSSKSGGCSLRVSFTPPKPGVYPVTVGYGGAKQALAGFFTASGGVAPPKWIQPGYPCTADDQCASASPYKCGCQAGRCRCAK